jgi:CDP-diacylglycerol--glycerol-3-phosphate 3-phosphatidyltransferase
MKIAVLVTWSRIALIPVMVVLYWLPFLSDWWAGFFATAVFVIAALTDWLDGKIARYRNEESRFGRFLDPVADKLLVSVALIMIVLSEDKDGMRWLLGILSMIIIGREICISALREWMAEIGAQTQVRVSPLGKWKTAAQMVAIGMLMFGQNVGGFPTRAVGLGLLTAACILTVLSMLTYLRAAWPHLMERE